MSSTRAKAAQNILQLVANARLGCLHHTHYPQETSALVHHGKRHHSNDGSKSLYSLDLSVKCYNFRCMRVCVRDDQLYSAFWNRCDGWNWPWCQAVEIKTSTGCYRQERGQHSCFYASYLLHSLIILIIIIFREVAGSLKRNGVEFNIFDNVLCEPSDESMLQAVNFAKKGQFDCFIAVGGGSVIDTTKVDTLIQYLTLNILGCCSLFQQPGCWFFGFRSATLWPWNLAYKSHEAPDSCANQSDSLICNLLLPYFSCWNRERDYW